MDVQKLSSVLLHQDFIHTYRSHRYPVKAGMSSVDDIINLRVWIYCVVQGYNCPSVCQLSLAFCQCCGTCRQLTDGWSRAREKPRDWLTDERDDGYNRDNSHPVNNWWSSFTNNWEKSLSDTGRQEDIWFVRRLEIRGVIPDMGGGTGGRESVCVCVKEKRSGGRGDRKRDRQAGVDWGTNKGKKGRMMDREVEYTHTQRKI